MSLPISAPDSVRLVSSLATPAQGADVEGCSVTFWIFRGLVAIHMWRSQIYKSYRSTSLACDIVAQVLYLCTAYTDSLTRRLSDLCEVTCTCTSGSETPKYMHAMCNTCQEHCELSHPYKQRNFQLR